MQAKLVIYLHAQDLTHPDWALVNADGTIAHTVLRGNPDALLDAATDKSVIVIVPAEDVLLTSVNLPKMNRSRLAQALPFALEEQLINDVETMHFAAGDYQAEGVLPVAVTAQEKMQQWMNLFSEWMIKPDVLIPASLVLPVAENTWFVAASDMLIVRLHAVSGFACDRQNLAECLQLAAATTSYPPMIRIQNYTSHAFASMLAGTTDIKEEFLPTTQEITDFAQEASKKPAINLLQGPYAAKKSRMPQMGRVWQIVSYLAITWVVLLFLYPTISYFILHQRVSSIEKQVAQIYKRNFPNATSIVAPKMRMQEKLQKLNADVGENRLLQLLGYIGKGMLETPSIKLKRMEFQSSQLTLELTAASSDDFATFTDYLTKQGLNVKQQNANLAGAHISATLQIE